MPLVRVRIYLGQKLVAEPARPFSSGDSIRAIIDEALLPFGVELELKAVDVFKDAAEKIRTAQLPIAHLGGVTAGELVASDYGTNLVAHVQKTASFEERDGGAARTPCGGGPSNLPNMTQRMMDCEQKLELSLPPRATGTYLNHTIFKLVDFSATVPFYRVRPAVTGAELVLNEWTAKPIIDEYNNRAIADFYELASVVETIDGRMPGFRRSQWPGFQKNLRIHVWDCSRSQAPLGEWWTHVPTDISELSRTKLCSVPVACGVSLIGVNSGSVTESCPVARHNVPCTSSRGPSDAGAALVSGSRINFALNTIIDDVAATGVAATSGETALRANQSSTLPIFRAPINSGCTATCTDSIERLSARSKDYGHVKRQPPLFREAPFGTHM